MIKIAIHGLAGSGKDTFANFIEELFEKKKLEYIREAFANPLKDLLSNTLGVDRSIFDDQTEKSKPIINKISPRKLMSFVGTDVFRSIDEDVWVNLTMCKVKDYENVIITDVRFNNEAERLKQEGFYIINMTRHGVERLNHESEKGIDDKYFDEYVLNFDIEGLKVRAEQIFNKLYTRRSVEAIKGLIQPYFGLYVYINDNGVASSTRLNSENFDDVCHKLSVGAKLRLKPMCSLLSNDCCINREILEEFSAIEMEHYENAFCLDLGRPTNWKDSLNLTQYEILLKSMFDVYDLHSEGIVEYYVE